MRTRAAKLRWPEAVDGSMSLEGSLQSVLEGGTGAFVSMRAAQFEQHVDHDNFRSSGLILTGVPTLSACPFACALLLPCVQVVSETGSLGIWRRPTSRPSRTAPTRSTQKRPTTRSRCMPAKTFSPCMEGGILIRARAALSCMGC